MLILVKTRRGALVNQVMVDGQRLVIGRNAEVGLRLNGWKVSGEHAEIHQDNGRYFLRDMGSRTGTQVGGEKVREFGPLEKGHRIEIGDYVLEILQSEAVEQARPAQAPDPIAPVEDPPAEVTERAELGIAQAAES